MARASAKIEFTASVSYKKGGTEALTVLAANKEDAIQMLMSDKKVAKVNWILP